MVRGDVHGVGYRSFVEGVAIELGLSGYARNLDDGRVEVYVTGTSKQVDEIRGYLWKGPRMADVRGVEEFDAPFEKHLGFHIE